jgi:hypothetical protein
MVLLEMIDFSPNYKKKRNLSPKKKNRFIDVDGYIVDEESKGDKIEKYLSQSRCLYSFLYEYASFNLTSSFFYLHINIDEYFRPMKEYLYIPRHLDRQCKI